MQFRLPPLQTERLLIRELSYADLEAVYQLLDIELAGSDTGSAGAGTIDARERWLRWTVLGYEAFAELYQFPFGDRAIVRSANDELVGLVGLNPAYMPFGQLPRFGAAPASRHNLEVGLFYAVAPTQRGQGFAAEAAAALIRYVFDELQLARIVATTTSDNAASVAVMRRLGMRIERNPLSTPPYFQVTGIREAGSD